MVQSFVVRRFVAAGLLAAFAYVVAFASSPAEARPRHYGYSAHSFRQFQERRYQEYYSNYRSYGYQYASQADAYRYGHLYARPSDRYAARAFRQAQTRRDDWAGFRRRDQAEMRRDLRRDRRHAFRVERERDAGRRHGRHRAIETALMPQDGGSAQATRAPAAEVQGTSSNIVAEARRYIGGNPTGRRSLWCARFMNLVLQRSGHRTTGSDMARSFASYGRRVSGPQVGAIAVMSRGRGGGHVGVVSGIDARGNPILVSGNHGHRVAEAAYSRRRIYAYVMPN